MAAPGAVLIGFLVVGVTLVVAPVVGQELPSRPSYNEVYPNNMPTTTLPPPRPDNSASRSRNFSRTTDLRQFIMLYVQDERICSDPALRDIILGEDGGDERGKMWWTRRCGGGRRGPAGTRLPTQSESSGDDRKNWKTIKKLMKNTKLKCKPKKTAVPLPNPDHTELKPECVYIKQCSGCCDSTRLECLPVRKKMKTFPVMELTKWSKGFRFTKDHKIRMVNVEEHRECQCECKVRREHCTPSQEYNEDACQCQCPSHVSRSCPQRKVWNEAECRCECRRSQSCTTGRYFDVNTCRC